MVYYIELQDHHVCVCNCAQKYINRKRKKRQACAIADSKKSKHLDGDQTPPLESTPVSHQAVAESPGNVAESPDTQISGHTQARTLGTHRKKPRLEPCGFASDSSTPPLIASPVNEDLKAPIPQLGGSSLDLPVPLKHATGENKRSGDAKDDKLLPLDQLSNNSSMDEEMKMLFCSSLMVELSPESNFALTKCSVNNTDEKSEGKEPQGKDELEDDDAFLDALGIMEGDKPGDVEEELGLYPEDFSFLFNSSSAFLPQEECSASTVANPKQGTEGVCVGATSFTEHVSSKPRSLDSFSLLSQAKYPPVSSSSSCSHIPSAIPGKDDVHPLSRLPFKPATSLSGLLPHQQVQYPINTFYGLPLSVQSCLKEYRGITKLYGERLM